MYDHRVSSVVLAPRNAVRQNQPRYTTLDEHADQSYRVTPLYWVAASAGEQHLGNRGQQWLLGFKDITSATNERTFISCIIPRLGVGNKIPLILTPAVARQAACLLACLNNLVFDYVVRQKVAGVT